MGLFQKVEGEQAILSINGVYKQVDLYTWDSWLYAQYPGGFVRLMEDGSTSKPKLTLKHMTWTGDLHRDAYGRLAAKPIPGTVALPGPTKVKLLGAPDAE